jgi:ABC-type lipoprotein export system ATPase subunit
MNPTEFYSARTEYFSQQVNRLKKLENRLAIYRLITFVSAFVFLFALITFSLSIAVTTSVLLFFAFGILVKRHLLVEKHRKFNQYMETINRRELECINGNFSVFPDGSQYTDVAHPYTYDLDIFGKSSLFQFVNRTFSKPASDLLASWLKAPAELQLIPVRQKAVEELKPLTDWRQKLIALGYSNPAGSEDPQNVLEWLTSSDLFRNPVKLRITSYLLSLFTFFVLLLVVLGAPLQVMVPVFAINFLFYFFRSKIITELHNRVSRSSAMMEGYGEAIGLIEDHTFSSDGLKKLHQLFFQNEKASLAVSRLRKLTGRLDARMNILVAIPLNLFFFWDIHCCLALEKWKRDHAAMVTSWFDAMAEFEVLSSFANMAFNNPGWAIPVIHTDYFILKAKEAGHPLIAGQRRITNSFEIDGQGRSVIITGSNMSGKSTFLRTCGINGVLAFAGSVVCASEFAISHVHVLSSMRISDSLEDNTSSFYAELKKLAYIIRYSENNQHVLLLLDEILRGTNSNDRYIGSVALIKQLIHYGTVSLVATHDLRLADMTGDLPGKIDNYHFDVKIDGEELYFDYLLNPGICTSLNASLLMKKMGIKI